MKSALYREFATDKSREVSGIWVSISGPNADGTQPEFLISRAGGRNKKYEVALERITEPYREELATKTLSVEKSDALEAQVTVEGILLDWRHVQKEDGNVIPFSESAAISLLTEIPDARVRLNVKAGRIDTFSLYRREKDQKN